MRKNCNGFIFIIGFLLSIFSFFPILNVNALTISHPPNLEIFSNPGECFSNSEFWFQIGNNGIGNVTVTPNIEVMYMENWQDFYNITFDKGNITLLAGESVRYHPTVCNDVELGYGYQLHFTFEGRTLSSGNVVTTGVGANVLHTVYSDDQGMRLQIRSVDQADREINTYLRLYYGGRAEKGQGWSIIQSINTTYYENILLEGWYRILAIEPTIQDQWDETFYLDTDISKNLIFELLAFTDMQIFIPKLSNESGRITYTLSNNYPMLTNVYIHFFVQTQSGALIYNSTAIKPQLDRGIYQDTLFINTTWYSDTYFFIGEVWVNGRLFIHQNETQILYFPDNPYPYGETSTEDLFPVFVVISLIFIVLLGIAFFRHEITEKIREYQEKQKEKQAKLENDK